MTFFEILFLRICYFLVLVLVSCTRKDDDTIKWKNPLVNKNHKKLDSRLCNYIIKILKIKDKIFERKLRWDLNLDYPIDKTSISIELQFLKNIKT